MEKMPICPLSNQNPSLLMLEWKPPADFNNPPPQPVRLWNKNQGGGESLKSSVLCQVACFSETI
jgi:hypothetical protein